MKRSLCSLLLCMAPALALAQPKPVISNDSVEYIHLNPGGLPSVRLTSDVLYRLLVAEVAATRSEFGLAAQTMLDLARETTDPRLAKRAFQFAMAERNMVRALNAAREWAALAPKDPEAVASSLALSASNGETSGLASALRARIQKADNKEQAVAQASVIVNKMSDKKLALQVLEQALDPSVRSLPIAHLVLSDAAWAADEPARALAEARKALAAEPGSDAAAQRILEYGLKVDPDRALNETQAYVQRQPDSRQLQLMLVNRLVGHKKFDQALQQVARMRSQSPEDFDLLYTEAEVNARAGRYDAAKSLLNQYIAIQQQRRKAIRDGATNAQADVSDARLLLVQIAERQNDLREAIRQLRNIDEPTLLFQARTHEAVLYGRLGDLSQSRAILDAIKPADRRERAVLRLTLASIYRDAGRTDQAVDLLKAADLEMPDTPEIKYDLGMLLHQQGKTAEFEGLMRRVIELDPDNANAYNSLGYTYVEQNRNLDEARGLLERALELEPDSAYILDSVGWYLFRIRDYQGALEYLRRSYDQLPAADVAAHLGETLWALGRHDEARRIWAEGRKADPDSAALKETLDRLGVKLP